jgi:hypothetical protein
VTRLARAVVLGVLAATLIAAATPSDAGSAFRPRRVVFVTIIGHGHVSSMPKGINCPSSCRSNAFFKSERVRLVAHPAAGWRLVNWDGQSCAGANAACAFNLVDSHDCAHGACPVGAFGLRVTFARVDGSS